MTIATSTTPTTLSKERDAMSASNIDLTHTQQYGQTSSPIQTRTTAQTATSPSSTSPRGITRGKSKPDLKNETNITTTVPTQHPNQTQDQNQDEPKDNSINPFETLISGLLSTLDSNTNTNPSPLTTDPTVLQTEMHAYTSHERDWSRYALSDPSQPYTRNLVHEGTEHANILVIVWNEGSGSVVHDHAGAHCVMKVLKGRLVEKVFRAPSSPPSSSSSSSSSSSTTTSTPTSTSTSPSLSPPSPLARSNLSTNTSSRSSSSVSVSPSVSEEETKSPESNMNNGSNLVQISQQTYTTNQVAYIADTIGLHSITNASADEKAVSLHLYTPPHAATFGVHVFDQRTGRRTHVKQAGFYSRRGEVVGQSIS